MSIIVKSRIRGEFHGWTGDGIYELDNGSRWQQVRYRYRYRYKYHPKAIIERKGGRYYLHVDGMNESIQVRRV